ncbi:hypothetical protein FHR24_000174 [Wenyingzhuangia heitensis]|uniref:Secreted protein n=1 Tax=Wenyingzhuangia heitensis TaxID=1487859 RepID=A0ABX0U7L2_9FLAO|nr:DUF6660 family protein [Wenyingzhuangia heitensis]NIJ43735.1 hypothetical protein [Wenyingzhuangia heitensis]
MRAIAFVLAVFICLLALNPCADKEPHAEDEKYVQVGDTHSHNSDAQDDCSAFCICLCCGASVQLVSVIFFDELKEIELFSTRVFGYKSFYKSYYSNSIWEPPIV